MHKMTVYGFYGLVAVFLLDMVVLRVDGTSSQAQAEDHRHGSIIRKITPLSVGTYPAREHEMLFFNTTAIGDKEEIIRVRLYLHRRRMLNPMSSSADHSELPTPARVFLYKMQKASSQPRHLVSLPIAPSSPGGWTHLDITSEFTEIHGVAQMLAVQFVGSKGNKVALKNFLKRVQPSSKRPSMAYVVVVSRSQQKQLKERHHKHREWKSDQNAMSNHINPQNAMTRVRKSDRRNTLHPHHSGLDRQSLDELKHKRELRIQPFLHLNEMADIQRRLRTKRSFTDIMKLPNEINIKSSVRKSAGKSGLESHYMKLCSHHGRGRLNQKIFPTISNDKEEEMTVLVTC